MKLILFYNEHLKNAVIYFAKTPTSGQIFLIICKLNKERDR
ncbi:hypothetical protein X781_12540 [Mannheimia sp. USDA-ARS-USMARC-1261]|nr:hypothetical protein X781_12540 [Mannheimia sp. USDA-ARS-USMARC-1261]